MDNVESQIIIIDNNASNGVYLSACCRALMPKSKIKWLRISVDSMELSRPLPKPIEYAPVAKLRHAADIIERDTQDTSEIIVFYNPRLGINQGTVKSAVDSPITKVLKELVGSARRILVNVHSTELPTREIAEKIDPSFKTNPRKAKVICHHLITGAAPPTILEIVKETLDEWTKRNPQNGIKTMGATS
jgi:hypothetical protein